MNFLGTEELNLEAGGSVSLGIGDSILGAFTGVGTGAAIGTVIEAGALFGPVGIGAAMSLGILCWGVGLIVGLGG